MKNNKSNLLGKRKLATRTKKMGETQTDKEDDYYPLAKQIHDENEDDIQEKFTQKRVISSMKQENERFSSESIGDISQISHETNSKSFDFDPDSGNSLIKYKDSDEEAKWDWTLYESSINDFSSLSKDETSTLSLDLQDIKITMNKPFMYDSQLKWNWHKGWNLPMITVQINRKQFTGNIQNTKLKVELKAIKALPKSYDFKEPPLIKLNGETIKYLSKGRASFFGIKFTETSFKNEGLKFNLIISVVSEIKSKDQKTLTNTLISLKSPLIFVDSRKASRDSFDIKKQKIISKYFTPFHPCLVTKPIELKVKAGYQQIQNNLNGLCQYLGSSSLKNKIKHPLFLLFKFSNCIRLYYNPKIIKVNPKEKKSLEFKIIEEMQLILWSIEKNEAIPKEKYGSHEISTFENKTIVILVEEPNEAHSFHVMKTISENLERIEHERLQLTFNQNKIPKGFVPLIGVKLVEEYIQNYNEILKLKDKFDNEKYLLSEATSETRNNIDQCYITKNEESDNSKKSPKIEILSKSDIQNFSDTGNLLKLNDTQNPQQQHPQQQHIYEAEMKNYRKTMLNHTNANYVNVANTLHSYLTPDLQTPNLISNPQLKTIDPAKYAQDLNAMTYLQHYMFMQNLNNEYQSNLSKAHHVNNNNNLNMGKSYYINNNNNTGYMRFVGTQNNNNGNNNLPAYMNISNSNSAATNDMMMMQQNNFDIVNNTNKNLNNSLISTLKSWIMINGLNKSKP